MQLDIHQHEGLLHMLDVRGRVFDEPLAMPKKRPKSGHAITRSKATAQQSVLVELLEPLRIVHVGLAARHVLRVTSVDEKHLEATSLKNLEHRYPVHAGRFHRDGRD